MLMKFVNCITRTRNETIAWVLNHVELVEACFAAAIARTFLVDSAVSQGKTMPRVQAVKRRNMQATLSESMTNGTFGLSEHRHLLLPVVDLEPTTPSTLYYHARRESWTE